MLLQQELKMLGEDMDALRAMEAELALHAVHGTLQGDCPLAYTYYLAQQSRASVVIVHGYTEFMPKYHEIAFYCLQMGYNVFLYDQRGHGLSGREVEDIHLAHVERFSDYAEDLDRFIRQVVQPCAGDQPIFLFSHSMGGAVAAMYLMEHSHVIARSVLASPMVCPNTRGMPRRLLRLLAKRLARKNGRKGRFPYSGDFDPNADFAASGDQSYVRFRANLDLRIAEERYQNSTSTNGWMIEALSVQDVLLKRNALRRIDSPVLVFSAGRDRSVRCRPQYRFAARLPQGRLVKLPDAKHCIFTGTQEIRERFFREMFAFYEEQQR